MDRVSVRLQARGGLLLGGALAMLMAGFWRVDGVLAAMGLAGLGLAGLGWLAARRNLRRLRVAVEGAHAGRVGEPARWLLVVENPRRMLDAFGVGISFSAGGAAAERHALWVAAGSAVEAEWRLAPERRGEWEELAVKMESGFPLSLFRAESERRVPHRWLAAPRPLVPVELLVQGSRLDEAPQRALAAGETHGEPRGMRPYRAGDPPRAVSWPASVRSRARGGGLVVREFDPPGFHPVEVLVVFHSFGTNRELIRPDRFERALSLAAGALRHFQAAGAPARFTADFDGWTMRPAGTRRHLAACMETLAKAVRAAGTELHELRAVLEGVDEGLGVVLISDMPPDSWVPSVRLPRRHVAVDVRRYESGRGGR